MAASTASSVPVIETGAAATGCVDAGVAAATEVTAPVASASTAGIALAPGVAVVTGPIRVLCLGNELIADDAVGIVAARELARRLAIAGTQVPAGPSFDPAATGQAFELPAVGRVEVVETALTGMYLLEAVVGASKLIVIDSVLSGTVEPGTVLELTEADLDGPRGGSPHYIGLLEALELARMLGLAVPADVAIIAVEAGDSTTVGGRMTAPVAAAVPMVAGRVMARIVGGGAPQAGAAQGGAAAPGARGYDPG